MEYGVKLPGNDKGLYYKPLAHDYDGTVKC